MANITKAEFKRWQLKEKVKLELIRAAFSGNPGAKVAKPASASRMKVGTP